MDAIEKVCLGRVDIKHLFMFSMWMEVKDTFKRFPWNKQQESKTKTFKPLLWKKKKKKD